MQASPDWNKFQPNTDYMILQAIFLIETRSINFFF
jgi:hypothetical protein